MLHHRKGLEEQILNQKENLWFFEYSHKYGQKTKPTLIWNFFEILCIIY